MQLGVNIDHIATLRQARYAGAETSPLAEPSLLTAATASERGGASGITIHLRADRRHIQDADVFALRQAVSTRLNLEMGNTPEILAIALQVRPDEVCLVPENRAEVTTEGGLDALGQRQLLGPTIQQLKAAGIRVSLFIEPETAQIEAAHQLGAEIVELHTGAFANAEGERQRMELQRLQAGAAWAHGFGLQVNAGHGINYTNIALIRTVPYLVDLNIGHSIVARALTVGLEEAVREMLRQVQDVRSAT